MRPRAKPGAQATEPSGGTRAGAEGEARGPAIFPTRFASLLARVLTLRFDQRLEAFDDQPLREFLAQREVLAVREHFFQCNHVPYLAVMVTYALEPSTPTSGPRDAAQGRKGIDWRAQVAEAEIPLYDALRDWRAERARRDGVAPYMICTNQQLAAMTKARPQSMSKLGTVNGIGKAKLDKHGQKILALLAWPRGAPATPAQPARDSGSAAPPKAATPDQATAVAEGGSD